MTEPTWLTRARNFIGIAETPGVKNSPELMAVLDWADDVAKAPFLPAG